MQLTVERIKPLQKSLAVTADGKEYLAKKDSGISAGMTIEAEVEISDYNGKTYHWIKKYKSVNGSIGATTTPVQHNGQSGGNLAWLPFASNTVAHAINAGLIKEPSEVKSWAAAAKQAFQELA
jgi:hypothetical protein